MDVAALNLAVRFDQVQGATAALKEQTKAASASERAAQRWGLATGAAARTSEDFSKRVQRTIRDLEFERQQLTRSAAAKERYAVLRRAGVSESSAEGRAILASVVALQAQRSANEQASKASGVQVATSRAAGVASRGLLSVLGPLATALSAAAVASYAWSAGMKAADYGEQAEQIGVSTDLLQAYRFAGAQAGIQTEQMDTAITKLAKTMGSAADGSKEQIELFQRLGVKLLDAQGELRPVAEILPEVARGVLNIGSSSQRTATLMELFGRSGAKMTTVLAEIAEGNDTVVAKARAAGVVLDAEVIAAWDRVSDSLTRAKLAADTTFAKLGEPIATSALEAIEKLLRSINEVMDQINSKDGFWASVLAESRGKGRIGSGPNALRLETPAEKNARLLAEKQKELSSPAAQGRESMIQTEIDRLSRDGMLARQSGMEDAEEAARRGRLPAMGPASGGARNPVAKGGAGSDPYAKAIESAREYVLSKRAETEAVGQTVLAAARLKHEQDLLNKATGEGKTLSDAQKAALQSLAGQMAEADNALAKAKFTDDARTKSEEFLAQQQLERDSLFMSAQAADALRFSTEMLNAAKRQGIELSPEEVEAIRASADAMAESKAKTDEFKEIVGLGRDVFKGFFSDMREGLMNGQTIWQSFGDAAVNALNRIAEKLIEMAAMQLFEAAFPGGGGGGGGGGGLFGTILSSVVGAFSGGGGGGDAWSGLSPSWGFANGAAFRAGNVIPFAAGGMVSSPTMFPMSGGRSGLMGEAGPEAIMPLRRGKDGRLGVQMSAAGQGQSIVVTVTGDTDLVRVTARDEFGKGIAVAGPQIEQSAVKKSADQTPFVMNRHESQTGGDWRFAR
jgi:hypothetical protein